MIPASSPLDPEWSSARSVAGGGLRIGYIRRGLESDSARAMLHDAECQVVRYETRPGETAGSGLRAILAFLRQGDQLVVPSLGSLGGPAEVLDTLQVLERRGAVLQVLHPRFTAAGEAARALAAGLAHVAPKQGARPNPSTREMQALRAAGLRTGEIARRLGVSRMTVWRRLQAAQSIDATD